MAKTRSKRILDVSLSGEQLTDLVDLAIKNRERFTSEQLRKLVDSLTFEEWDRSGVFKKEFRNDLNLLDDDLNG